MKRRGFEFPVSRDASNGYGAQIGLDLNSLRTAAVTRQSGEAQKRQVRLDLAWAEWNTAGQARLQGVRLFELKRQLKVAQASRAAAERMYAAVARAAGRGDVSATDLDARRQALVDAQSKYRQAEVGLATARTDLNEQLGLPPETRLAIAARAQVCLEILLQRTAGLDEQAVIDRSRDT